MAEPVPLQCVAVAAHLVAPMQHLVALTGPLMPQQRAVADRMLVADRMVAAGRTVAAAVGRR